MNLFGSRPAHARRTGQAITPDLVEIGWVCDFCGQAHTEGDDYEGSEVSYHVAVHSNAEPPFETCEVEGQPDVDIYALFDVHPGFRFCMDWDSGHSCEVAMLTAGVGGEFGHWLMVANLFYEARCRMLAKVLTEGTYKLWQFGLVEPTVADLDPTSAESFDPAIPKALEELNLTDYLIITVPAGTPTVKELLQGRGVPFKTGQGYYQLGVSPEQIGPDKSVILRKGDKLYSGPGARAFLRLPASGKGSATSLLAGEYTAFIQTRSNRKLIGGTSFIYALK